MISFVLFPQASPPSMNFNIIYPNWSNTSTKTKWKNVLPQNMRVFIAQWMSSTLEYLQEKKHLFIIISWNSAKKQANV